MWLANTSEMGGKRLAQRNQLSCKALISWRSKKNRNQLQRWETMLSYSTYAIIISATHSSSIITRAVILINGKNGKWSSLEKHWRKLEDSLAANTCNPMEDTPSAAKEGDVSFRGISPTTVRLSLLDATLGILSSRHTVASKPKSGWPSLRPLACSEGSVGPCSFPSCVPGRAAGFTSTAIGLSTGSSSWRWKKEATSTPTVNTKHKAQQDWFS